MATGTILCNNFDMADKTPISRKLVVLSGSFFHHDSPDKKQRYDIMDPIRIRN